MQPPELLLKVETIKKVLKYVVLFIVAIVLINTSTFTVHQYERGVVTTWGKLSYVAAPGLGIKVPFVQSVSLYRTDLLELQPRMAVNTYTEDNQEIDIVFKVFYRIPPDNVASVYEHTQDYSERLYFIANDRVKAEMGRVKLEHFALHRGKVRDTIRDTLIKDAEVLKLLVTDFQFTDVNYTKAFRDAVEKASVQKAGVETKEWERQQAEKKAQTDRIVAEGTANAVREEAKGEADAIAFKATADARAIEIKGAAHAKAMHLQAEALARNPVLVEMRKAEAWDGKLPTAVYAGAPIPFLQVK